MLDEAAACGSPRAGDTAAMREVSCGAKSHRVTQMVTCSLLEIRLLVCLVRILVQGRFAFVRPSFCCECSYLLGSEDLEGAEWLCIPCCGDASTGLWAAAAQFPPLTLLVLVLMSCRPVECVELLASPGSCHWKQPVWWLNGIGEKTFALVAEYVYSSTNLFQMNL